MTLADGSVQCNEVNPEALSPEQLAAMPFDWQGGNPADARQESERAAQEAERAEREAYQARIQRAQFIGQVLDSIGNLVEVMRDKTATLSQKIGAFGNVIMNFLPPTIAPIFGGVLSIVQGFLGKKKPVVTVDKVLEPIRVFPETTGFGLGANPTSRLFGNRGIMTGAGVTVQVVLDTNAQGIVNVVKTALGRENMMTGKTR